MSGKCRNSCQRYARTASVAVSDTCRGWLRSAGLNLVGNTIPLATAIVTIPITIHVLGPERFGVLTLLWALLAYFGILDFGMSRATTKFVAEYMAAGDRDAARRTVRSAVGLQGLIGLAAGAIVVYASPLIVERLWGLTGALRSEATTAVRVTGLALPVVLVSGTVRGAIEATQRFDLANAIRVPQASGMYLLPAAGARLGWSITQIVAAIVVWLGFMLVLQVRAYRTAVGRPAGRGSVQSAGLGRFLSFSAWTGLSAILSPVLAFSDRFVIAAVAGVGAVTYYAAPYEMATRLWVLPASLAAVLFPSISAISTRAGPSEAEQLVYRAVKATVLTLGVLVVAIVWFSAPILKVWLGADFALRSQIVLQILVVGVLANSIASPAYAFIQGLGRPDVTAKLHLAEVPGYLFLVWIMTTRWGISGAAIAWCSRVSIDAVLLFVSSSRLGLAPAGLHRHRVNVSLALVGLSIFAAAVVPVVSPGVELTVAPFVGWACMFCTAVWTLGLDGEEKRALLRLAALHRGRANLAAEVVEESR